MISAADQQRLLFVKVVNEDDEATLQSSSLSLTTVGWLAQLAERMSAEVYKRNYEVARLHESLKALALENGGSLPGAEVVELVEEWFGELGVSLDAMTVLELLNQQSIDRAKA